MVLRTTSDLGGGAYECVLEESVTSIDCSRLYSIYLHSRAERHEVEVKKELKPCPISDNEVFPK